MGLIDGGWGFWVLLGLLLIAIVILRSPDLGLIIDDTLVVVDPVVDFYIFSSGDCEYIVDRMQYWCVKVGE